jgi:hypothetical protein
MKLSARSSNVLLVCAILALLGNCDSYNLSFDKFLNGTPDDVPSADSDKAITAFTITSPVSATGVIDEVAKTIAVTVPYDTPVTGLVPGITHTGASVSPASGAARDFTDPVIYTVTAVDGSTETYTVTVTVASASAKAITAFTFPSPINVAGVINEETKTIDVTVPYGTDVTSLTPTITHTGASVSPLSGTVQNFATPVSYTVTATDNSTVIYEVTVTVAFNPAKAITAFTFPSPVNATGNINEEAKTIDVIVPFGTDVTDLIPAITVSPGASVNPASGETQDFTGSVTYTVTAADGTDQTYTITVTMASGSAKEITAFTFPSPVNAVGVINEETKIIDVTVPYGTVVTNLTPDITHTGAGINPAFDVAQNFTYPVPYTVTAADSSFVTYTVTVTVSSTLNSVAEVGAYLAAASGGTIVLPPLAINLAAPNPDGWAALLNTIKNRAKYVSLDLSDCTMSDTVFDPGTANTGETYIVSLTLPDAATSIASRSGAYSTFRYFNHLNEVSGGQVTDIRDNAFNSTNLTAADFPAATSIGYEAFRWCDLTTADFPEVTSIDNYAFERCDALTTVCIPEVTSIGKGAFLSCDALTTIDLPATLTSIGDYAFGGCTGLTTINVDSANTAYKHSNDKKALLSITGTLIAYPSAAGTLTLGAEVTAVGEWAFYMCDDALTSITIPNAVSISSRAFYSLDVLTTVYLPAATSIGNYAFANCTSLTTVYLPAAASIDFYAFAGSGTVALTVTLGSTPPTLGVQMFNGVSSKNVTIEVPTAALSAYGPVPDNTTSNNWGNAFRGKGWTGSSYSANPVNGNINLTFATY